MALWDVKGLLRRTWRALRAHWGEIAYYAGIALALTALAVGAERYRRGGEAGPEPVARAAADSSAAAAEEAPEAGERAALPEGAEVLRAYSRAPAWSETLGLWESHPALDCRLPGREVRCLLSGTVRSVERGGSRGGCLEVECGAVALRYASIAPREDLLPGDAVEAGELLGAADDSMPGESSLGAHLHLELLSEGEALDFAEWAERAPSTTGD